MIGAHFSRRPEDHVVNCVIRFKPGYCVLYFKKLLMLKRFEFTYSDLTHTVTLTTLGRSLSHCASLILTTPLTPTGALTRGVSSTHRASHTRAVLLAPAVSSCGAPCTHRAFLTHFK